VVVGARARAARLDGPRAIKPHEREALLSCVRASREGDDDDDGGDDAGDERWRQQRLWSEANLMRLSNCAAILSRDGQVVAAAAFAVGELATAAVRHTGLGANTALRIGLTDACAAQPEYQHQARVCLRSAVRQQEAQNVLLSVLSPRGSSLGADNLAALGFSAAESGVYEYTLLRSDADRFHHQLDTSGGGVAISLLDEAPSDGVLRALHWLHATSERSSASQLVRNLAQTRRVHTLPSTFTKIARRLSPSSAGSAPSELVAYIVCQYPSVSLDGGSVKPLVLLEGGGDEVALAMLIRDALLERRRQPGTLRLPTSSADADGGVGEEEVVAAIAYGYSQPTALGNVLLDHLGPQRRSVSDARGAHYIRISQPVELLRSLAAAGLLGSARCRSDDASAAGDGGGHDASSYAGVHMPPVLPPAVTEFSLTVFDEDDAIFGGGGLLISLRYQYLDEIDASHFSRQPADLQQQQQHTLIAVDSHDRGWQTPAALPSCLNMDTAAAPPRELRAELAHGVLGVECVRGSDPAEPAGAAATSYSGDSSSYRMGGQFPADELVQVDDDDDDDVFEHSQPSLSVSALGRQVEEMGARIAHWSAAKAPAPPRHHPRAGAISTTTSGRRRPIGRVVQRRDGGVQVYRGSEVGGREPATCTHNWLWSCCGDENESSGGNGNQPPPNLSWVARPSSSGYVQEGVPPPRRQEQQQQRSLTMLAEPLMTDTSGSMSAAAAGAAIHSTSGGGGYGDTAAAGWVVEHAAQRSAVHATISRSELSAALFGGAFGGGEAAVPQWLREALGCEPLCFSDLDFY
jgi:hypothetical protein